MITYNHKYKLSIPNVLSTKHFNLHNLKTYGDKHFPLEDDHLIIKTCREYVNSFIPYTQILMLGRWLVYNYNARQQLLLISEGCVHITSTVERLKGFIEILKNDRFENVYQ